MMEILITNDDGINSKLFQLLKEKLKNQGHDIYVVAPKTNQSDVGTMFTTRKKLKYEKINEKEFCLEGTTSDCIYFMHSNMKKKFDLVISGINDKKNVGYVTLDSGTVAGARLAAILGFKSIAISLSEFIEENEYEKYVDLIVENLKNINFDELEHDHFYNMNVPYLESFEDYEIVNTKLARFRFNNVLEILNEKECKYVKKLPDSYYIGYQEDEDAYNHSMGKITLSKVKVL